MLRVQIVKLGQHAFKRSLSNTVRLLNDGKMLEDKTPMGRFSDVEKKSHKQVPKEKSDPFARFPDETNPQTGEVGGPTGPEPTRYGDWERKGRI